jgi:hypothetical protein
VGLEVFTKGTDGAFDGALARFLPARAAAAAPEKPPLERIRAKVFGARDEREERTYRAAGEDDPRGGEDSR